MLAKSSCIAFCFSLITHLAFSQTFLQHSPNADEWVNKTYRNLSKRQRIAQLMIIRAHSNLGKEHLQQVSKLIKKYHVGGLCFFQGGPFRQALLTNNFQQISKTPLLIAIDGEWGLGMRLDSVLNFPRQLMVGAVQDTNLIYELGASIGKQCKRLGIQLNFAPVVDVNNNPNNPIINDRSFGEDKFKVARFGIQYMKGLQDCGVMACAKHFPGHGDVNVDSHLDLPVIHKSLAQLDSLEIYPFKQIIDAGVGCVMSAHLFIPSIDSTPFVATSLSRNSVTNLLEHQLNFQGIKITDGLEMKGITKYQSSYDANLHSLMAGNDMLCLPSDIPKSLRKIRKAIRRNILSKEQIEISVKKILLAKYNLGLNNFQLIDTNNLIDDLNKETQQINFEIAANAITLVKSQFNNLLPITSREHSAYIAFGTNKENTICSTLSKSIGADVYCIDTSMDKVQIERILSRVQLKKYSTIVAGLHQFNRKPANNFNLKSQLVDAINLLPSIAPTMLVVFGNPYSIKNFCSFKNILACYEDDSITQQVAAEILIGSREAKGKLPVTVCQ